MANEFIYHLNFRGMSGRIVRFRILDADEVEVIEDNGERAAGEDASAKEIRRQQLKELRAAFLVAYTDPGQEPAYVPVLGEDGKQKMRDGKLVVSVDRGRADPKALETAKFHAIENAALLQARWSTIFNAKESEALKVLFLDNHEINGTELEMLLGKALPASTGG